MATQKPAATAQTNSREGSMIKVSISPKRKVTYVFDTAASKKTLKLPYAVSINGKVLKEFGSKPLYLQCDGGKIEVMANPGEQVALLLNSDAHPAHRRNPVYAVTPDANDVVVSIVEKLGKHADADTPVLSRSAKDSGKPVDHYTAPLTGNIWLKVSHKYTVEQAAALIPSDTSATIRDSVLSIYKGLPSRFLKVAMAAGDPAQKEAEQSITVEFADASNPKNNVVGYSLLAEGLPRVHPLGYVALLNAARDAGVTKLRMNSGWRPQFGSIAHRAGLGLDVDYLEDRDRKVQVNREQLRGKGPKTEYVSAEEKRLFAEYEAARKQAERSTEERVAAQSAYLKGQGDPARVKDLKERLDAASERRKNALAAESKAIEAWNKELDKNEPVTMRTLRTRLERFSGISQIFDPWYMDENTRDAIPHKPNEQRNSNETTHAHHLHITVSEPKIL